MMEDDECFISKPSPRTPSLRWSQPQAPLHLFAHPCIRNDQLSGKKSTTAVARDSRLLMRRTARFCFFLLLAGIGSTSSFVRQGKGLSMIRLGKLATKHFSSFVKLPKSPLAVRTTRHFSSASFNPDTIMSVSDTDLGAGKHSDYERWVRRLYMTNMFHPVKLGLENIEKLYELLGNPLDDAMVIHIAGTNGKGSVALKCARTLELALPDGNVGLFCSPHVSSFRERMQVNGNLISEDEVVSYLPEIYGLCQKHDIPATFFEITTALAFRFYSAKKVDAVVLETGLGGRLDATNILRNPAISVITSIGLEHTRILGDTVEKIALEKGGIIKKGCPVLVGPNVPDKVLRGCAEEKGASSYHTVPGILGAEATRHFDDDEIDYDIENSLIAHATLKILKEEFPNVAGAVTDDIIAQGTSVRPPCRFEKVTSASGVTTILDVAHNPSAMEYMVRKLDATFPEARFRIVAGMSSDKDLRLCGASLRQAVSGDCSRIHFIEAAHPRAAKVSDIIDATEMKDAYFDLEDPSPTKQIKQALKNAKENGEILVVCGSVFIMAEAREALGFDEPRDSEYIAMVAGAGIRHSQENFGNTSMPEFTSKLK